MAYTTTSNIYNYTPLTESDVAGSTLSQYILDATSSINKEINSRINNELVSYIDIIKDNKIDGINKKYYVKKADSGVYFGDLNDDGEITINDVIVYLVDSQGNRTEATVSTINNDEMSITLSEAPQTGIKIYITYSYTYFDITIPDKLIEMATRYLAASYGFLKSENGLGDNIKIGNISVTGMNRKNNFLSMTQRFEDILIKIKGFSNTKNLPVRHIRI